ncbi:arginine--tRNA ligase [Shewanella oneidensis MR-1]|uniref:Arginine--tRNA ligase n=1 Tax=Shewanella oneidensis (strain ATCC 700550 / JCM 31522 / CIP 106686 / LMG 19005 / NCIMB 14063 / MR-1) TaxID=211586 RepID=SYR_SHEON|nr:arginine--tRNA ligase [Shewanella oneidensis]Q8E9Y7.1 RecName: Full=Arginine--tRNA ligase; AltName: Full=Arginyl-tRNA synthetase; Short=ArgRS [Shewanella oneidensis MR-1]AAN57096.1 arginyl-tRNA synthetase ArgS [Shewanella oneidensis MR-1]MDX5998574.1 arginine--tRNA ligase [Shewanella oneidensis]MEE2026603.1 Arginine--tRNA ligase [Shewanella oneidensis]QKG98373.1 arginine--tRNA ligase [Shewanella oneidensis MR-1]
MKSHIQSLLEQTIESFKQQGILPADFEARIQVDRTKDKSHGDLATNVAMMLTKAAGKNPRELAQLIIDNLPASAYVAKVEIAGPGFINFFIDDSALANQLQAAIGDEHLGIKLPAPQTVVVDYSSPNLAKEMHVGHLRSTIIGDSVVRTLEFLGHKVIRQNHVGDWGTQFGMLLAYMEELRAANGEQAQLELSDLETFYRAAKLRFDESAEFATRARQLVVALQSGDEYCNKLWREFNDISLSHCHEVYERLGVSLTRADVHGESAYNADLEQVVNDLAAKGLLTESNGAKVVFQEEFRTKEGEPLPVIIQKADGGYLYATTDLAAMRYRSNVLKADRVLYFVDLRQALHFQQVFSLAKLAKFVREDMSLEHLGFGTMNGEDGRPFKTRTGGVVKLVDLLDEANTRALELVRSKNPDMDEATLAEIARVVGISAVKYADLSKNRTSDYIFSFEQMLSFEGNTAPYLLYAYTRVAGIFKRATDVDLSQAKIVLEHEKEKDLGNKLAQFGEILSRVVDKGQPHVLCGYLYELAGAFSSFYEACPVLAADNDEQKHSRLLLSQLTASTLQKGLNLLGIETLERM